MSDVTQLLGQIEEGDGKVAEKLLPLVYDEFRKLTAAKMTQENPGRWRWCMSCAAFLSFMHVLRRSAMSTESETKTSIDALKCSQGFQTRRNLNS
ncbi:ECF-type sigma factor [Novipirellula artificiosorum]|uniref:ECF sigma factor n=1 Tax=Novipirellula artificiosorum TaxID=2528016 RepID=A0A5C6CB71_9BACT|nr:ECF-type sigma factor [Novipirellula artificiosorum]TWU21870.1 ECF sigma factor [Novipirellula artificiosorum]